MKLGELIPAKFIQRLNRFVCTVKLEDREETALLRNTGRLKELLLEGVRVYVRRKDRGKHKLELVLVETEKSLVCVDSHLPPLLLEEYLRSSGSPWEVETLKREYKAGNSRFDLLLNDRTLIETKSVNLVVGSTAMFPDAPTARGRRHIEELMSLSNLYEPAVVFIIQREDALNFSPNRKTDPEFSKALEEFYRRGHTVKAFLCKVSLKEIKVDREIPVIF